MISGYLNVRNVTEALAALANYPGEARILAGGTEAFSQLSQLKQAAVVVDISKATDLNDIDRDNQKIKIGAAVTLSRLLKTTWLEEEFPAIAEAVSRIGSPQIRNQGTVVGNVLTGRAASNVRVCVASMRAFLKVRGPNRERDIDIDDLDNNAHTLADDEIVLSLVIPSTLSAKASAYCCFTPRKGFSYPSASVSSSVAVDGGEFKHVSLVASPVPPTFGRSDMKPCGSCGGSCRICRVMHVSELEQNLVGRPAKEDHIEQVCSTFDWQSIPMRDSFINGTAEYRCHLLKVLSKKALVSALHRCKHAAKRKNGI
jgi:carbon-monoxide dehydrogenase medium subunit